MNQLSEDEVKAKVIQVAERIETWNQWEPVGIRLWPEQVARLADHLERNRLMVEQGEATLAHSVVSVETILVVLEANPAIMWGVHPDVPEYPLLHSAKAIAALQLRQPQVDREWRDWLLELDRKHSGRQGAIWAEIVAPLGLFSGTNEAQAATGPGDTSDGQS